MKLNNEENIIRCQKALYSKQLNTYSKLCNLYANLASSLSSKDSQARPEDIEKRYSLPLSLATHGKLDFIENYPENYFSQDEIDTFKKYSSCAKSLTKFKTASDILSNAITYDENSVPQISTEIIDEYQDYMEHTSKMTQNFNAFINKSTPRDIGHQSFLTTRQAINTINNIDPSHLNIDTATLGKNVTPSAFGAYTIRGVRGLTPSQVIDYTEALDIKDETQKKSSSQTNSIKRIFRSKNAKKIIIGIAASLAVIGGVSACTTKEPGINVGIEQPVTPPKEDPISTNKTEFSPSSLIVEDPVQSAENASSMYLLNKVKSLFIHEYEKRADEKLDSVSIIKQDMKIAYDKNENSYYHADRPEKNLSYYEQYPERYEILTNDKSARYLIFKGDNPYDSNGNYNQELFLGECTYDGGLFADSNGKNPIASEILSEMAKCSNIDYETYQGNIYQSKSFLEEAIRFNNQVSTDNKYDLSNIINAFNSSLTQYCENKEQNINPQSQNRQTIDSNDGYDLEF